MRCRHWRKRLCCLSDACTARTVVKPVQALCASELWVGLQAFTRARSSRQAGCTCAIDKGSKGCHACACAVHRPSRARSSRLTR